MHSNALRLKNGDPGTGARPGARRYPRLLVAVLMVWCLFIAYCLYQLTEAPLFVVTAAGVIATVALFPAYLWAQGYTPGLPILPLHALTFLWTHAFPLIEGHPEIGNYDADDILFSTLYVSVYVITAAAAWFLVATRLSGARSRYYVLPEDRGFAFFIAAIVFAGVFLAAAVGQMVTIDPGLFAILRASILALSSIALFVLSARMARGDLRPFQSFLFIAAAVFYMAVQLTTIFLIGAIIGLASALIGYTIGRRRVPWVAILTALAVFAFLHGGKGEMRERYWSQDSPTISYYELPQFFAEWIAAGVYELWSPETGLGHQPIYERVSLIHLLLLVQRQTPDFMPYLGGATYAIIPRLLVPRIIDPDKPIAHQGTVMLNVHYGIQTLEQSESTTIGWGLLNEAYANFGLAGVAGVGALLGFLFGFVGRLTAGAPVMSLESMIGITFSAAALQAEFTMAVFATVIFQSLMVLMLVTPFLEKRLAGDAA